MNFKTLKGKKICTLVFVSSFLKDASFGLDKFIEGLIKFKQMVQMETNIIREIERIIDSFNHFNKIFKKYQSIFKSLSLSSHSL